MNANTLYEQVWKFRELVGNYAFIAGKEKDSFSIAYDAIRYDFLKEGEKYSISVNGKAISFEKMDKLGNELKIKGMFGGSIIEMPLMPLQEKNAAYRRKRYHRY